MALTWTQRREALFSDCIVSPDVFNPMIGRLAEFVAPYQHTLETEPGQQEWMEERVRRHDHTPFHNNKRRLFYRIGSLSNYPLAASTEPFIRGGRSRKCAGRPPCPSRP